MKGSEKMYEPQKKAINTYRSKKATISITVSKEVKQLLDQGAEREKKSKAQYIADLIRKDNQQ